eukprot:345175-Pelagomonas_calceolata.AAC.1
MPFKAFSLRLTTIINTRHALCFHGGFWGGSAGRAVAEDGRRRVRASRRQATLQIPIRSISGSLLG